MLLTFGTELIAFFPPFGDGLNSASEHFRWVHRVTVGKKYAFSIYFGFCELALVGLRTAQAAKALIQGRKTHLKSITSVQLVLSAKL